MPYNAMREREFIPDERFMRLALQLAWEAYSADEVPVGAVVVKDGKVIGCGRNRREENNSVLGHAELEAMSMAAKRLGTWRLSGCTLYVTLEPCPMCAGAIYLSRIKRIVYGASDIEYGAVGGKFDLFELSGFEAHRPSVSGGILADECSLLLRNFFKIKRTMSTH